MDVPATHRAGEGGPREYLAYTLPQNGLRVCLISDPTVDKAAAAVGVAAGQLHDDDVSLPGIAHLTEHMLFMGSATYPIENEYDQYIQQAGGHSNAYTDLTLTCFYFDVSVMSKFQGGLDRLCCALSEPLVAVDSVERELQAVDSEHAKNLTQDHWRIHQLARTLLGGGAAVSGSGSNADGAVDQRRCCHPYANFGTGNKTSLLQAAAAAAAAVTSRTATETTATTTATTEEPTQQQQQQQYQTLRDNIVAFYQKHYIASNMTLAVLSSQSLTELQAMVEQVFAHKLPTGTATATTTTTSTASSSLPPPVVTTTKTTVIAALPVMPEVTVVQWVPLIQGGQSSQLELQWILPESQWTHYDSKPARYWSHLLGHEGPGSLLSALRDRQWAQELSADDASSSTSSFTLFAVNIELTTEGLAHVTQVLRMLFYYIDTVLKDIPAWVYDELKVTGDTTFRFLAKQDAAHTVSTLASNMHQYAPEHYLSGPYKIFDYDPQAVREIGQALSCKNSQNLLILLGSTDYEGSTDQVDPWYGTNYRIVPATDTANHVWMQLQQQQQQRSSHDSNPESTDSPSSPLTSALHLPARNDMLPTDFSLVADYCRSDEAPDSAKLLWRDPDGPFFGAVNATPRCLIDTATCRLWYKPDAVYQTPKVNFLAMIRSPILADSRVETAVLASLWVEVVTELCNEFSYAASMAGLHCGFQENSSKGTLEITVSGYNHKAGILLQRICDTLTTVLPVALSKTGKASDDGRLFFERMRSKLEQQYQSALMAQPYQHGSMVADLLLEASNKGTIHQRLAYLGNKNLLTSDDLLYFSKQVLSCFQLEVLVHGNVLPEVAIEWTNIILDTFHPASPLRLPDLRGVQLPTHDDTASECIYRLKGWNEHDENSCVVNIFQVGLVDIVTNATLSLLLQLLREPAFNILRTEEQLGYIVFTSVKTNADNVKSLLFLIQSESFDPIHVDERIENFLTIFRTKILVKMSDIDFQSNVDALCESMLEKNKNLGEESMKQWSVINNRTYQFHRLQDIAKAARCLTKVDVLRFFDRYVLAKSPFRCKLSIQLFGTAHESIRQELLKDVTKNNVSGVISIDDPDEFARSQALFPAQSTVSIIDLILTTTDKVQSPAAPSSS